jgi:predicted hotdog family 3-hydroxylacyl-ACP dehydratase
MRKEDEMNMDASLPLKAVDFIPHCPPMCLVDRLLEYEDYSGLIETVHIPDHLVKEDGKTIEPIALIEIFAQSYAAVKGFGDRLKGGDIYKGYLVGIRKFDIEKHVYAGDCLHTRVHTAASIEDFSIADGVIERSGEVVAFGSLKLYIAKQ